MDPRMLAKDVGLLYVGGLNSPFAEIKVTKTLKALDKKIIECRCPFCESPSRPP
jgi:mRNA-capping enzyme